MESANIKYPIGIQSFEELRRGGYAYVDKTNYIPTLLRNKYYFFARPRRFGKSLFLSTLEAYFKGKRDLFEGLSIADREKDWIEYPVIRIDFAAMNGSDISELLLDLRASLLKTASVYGLSYNCADFTIQQLFGNLISDLKQKFGRNVVVLIDEYDKGLIETIHNDSLLSSATDALRPFFSVLKSCDEDIKFAFLTGVSRFRNTTIFSGANNLKDISLDGRYASLMGISHEELVQNFACGIQRIADEYGYTRQLALDVLRNTYDGYRFTRREEYVYNPFSLLNALDSLQLDHYWVMSGTSKILASYLRGSAFSLEDLTNRWVSDVELSSPYSRETPLSIFFQTGYLTVREFDPEGYYLLGIPNREVQSALVNLLIPLYVDNTIKNDVGDLQRNLRRAISTGDIDSMMQTLRSLLSGVPYHEVDTRVLEKHVHLCFYMVFMMLGVSAQCEIASAAGRVDMAAFTPWRIYLFEFKIDGDADEALRQIDERGYAIRWEADERDVTKIGVNFSTKTRTIDSWVFKTSQSGICRHSTSSTQK